MIMSFELDVDFAAQKEGKPIAIEVIFQDAEGGFQRLRIRLPYIGGAWPILKGRLSNSQAQQIINFLNQVLNSIEKDEENKEDKGNKNE